MSSSFQKTITSFIILLALLMLGCRIMKAQGPQRRLTIEEFLLSEHITSETLSIQGRYDGVLDSTRLIIKLKSNEYIIPIQILNNDLNAKKRFKSQRLRTGDSIITIGRSALIDIANKNLYRGLEKAIIQLVDTTEKKPSFKGGSADEFSKWVNNHLKYPKIAKENGVQGRVTLEFTIETDGRLTNARVLRGVDPSLDAEALRVVRKSPKWKPGEQRGKPVKVTYTFPVIFQLR